MRSSAGGQHDDDDPIETVDRSVDKLETLVQHLRKASDNFSSERLSREKVQCLFLFYFVVAES
jgi:hypothetical protein